MVNKMGIRVNVDEAQALLISADLDNNNVLTINEFMGLIFSQRDDMKIDLSAYQSLEGKEGILIEKDEGNIFPTFWLIRGFREE